MHSVLIGLTLALATADPAPVITQPKVIDSRLKIEQFAADPDIVTPTGLAVDARGRVLVVESHTHFRPEGYVGPPADRIRMFEDTDGDGRADRISTFFEGTSWTMNIGVHTDGSVYVATRDEIFRLRDTDNDGRADERTPIAHLETTGRYPHNGLSGFAFDFDGNVYFGLGENKGAEFKLIGTDGSMASELEGGQIYRCRPDGTKIEMIALGFWNPFHLAFDTFGRLFAVDNDPDSLPPCRLLHIVPGGNYGYRYRNGRKGVHPFTAWNGELPGTLPMVAGTGEAPSGIVAYESDHLPSDYVGDLLVTSWGDHRIDRFRLEPRGASYQATFKPIVTGDENFRPVGIAIAPDGSLYVSDWVLKSYDVHGHGRVWHISAVDAKPSGRPTAPADSIRSPHRPLREQAARTLAADVQTGRPLLTKLAQSDPSSRVRAAALEALASVGDFGIHAQVAQSNAPIDVRTVAIRTLPASVSLANLAAADQPAAVRAEALRRVASPADAARLWDLVGNSDAFIAQAAREGLTRAHEVSAEMDFGKLDPAKRLAALLILRESHDPAGPGALPRFLRDPDSKVRFAAIQWVGEDRVEACRELLADALSAGAATGRLFAGYLAALERLDGVNRESSDEWGADQYIARALFDSKTTPEVRRWSLRMLRPDHPSLSRERLKQFIDGPDPELRLEAVRSLRDSSLAERSKLLAEIAGGDQYPANLRAEAIVGLSGEDAAMRALLISLAQNSDKVVRDESLRSLRGARLTVQESQALKSLASVDEGTAALVERVLNPSTTPVTQADSDLAGWLKLLGDEAGPHRGDPAAGERIFFHQKSAACARCHQVMGRGARIGPELTATTGVLSRQRLIESIVRPSQEIAPQFATWQIVTTDGKSAVGMLVKEEATGQQTYADQTGKLFTLQPGDVDTRQIQANSIMPQGLPQLMTVQEFRDLLAFLQSQKGG